MTRNTQQLQETYRCPDCGSVFEYARDPQTVQQTDSGPERTDGDPPRPQSCPDCGNTSGVFTVASVNGVRSRE